MSQHFFSRDFRQKNCIGAARFLAAAGLALLVIGAFLPVVDNGFVMFDDGLYIVDNIQVRGGLTPEGVRWAFSYFDAGYWLPITWLSHMLDVTLFGLQPQGHHLMGLLLHLTTALTALGVLYGMTGAIWPSVLAATLFAIHPLRVESVVWAAERKDLLSGLFWMLAMGAYLHYVRKPRLRRLVLVVFALIVSLLAKPMAVTLPFALLILDWWPLGRLRTTPAKEGGISLRALLTEKSPLFLASAVFVAITLHAQSPGGTTSAPPPVSWDVRFANAPVAYVRYLWLTLWPARLSFFYPYPEAYWLWTVTASTVLVALSLAAAWMRRRAPAFIAGWLWLLGLLVPVIGLVQIGFPALADRYTYLPSLGLAIALIWGARQVTLPRTFALVSVVVALPLCLSLLLMTRHQVRLWHDSRTLFGHAIELDESNWLARVDYGVSLTEENRFAEALPYYLDALRLQPANPIILNNLGVAYSKLGRAEDGMELLRRALSISPRYAEAHYNLGVVFTEAGKTVEAARQFVEVLQQEPRHRDALYNLGVLAAGENHLQEAARYYRQALAVDPGMAAAHLNLGVTLARLGMKEEAEHHLRETLRLDPGNAAARYNLSGLRHSDVERATPALATPR